MGDLWKVIGELAAGLHADRIASIADAIADLRGVEEFERAKPSFGPNADHERVKRLQTCWATQPVITPSEVSAAFRGAAEVTRLVNSSGAIEIVWTGPRTGLIPTRRTEQVLLEVIDSAQHDVFLVTYVFYKASTIIDALNSATRRGVDVSILLESSIEHGDGVKTMAEAVPGAHIYIWDPSGKSPDQGGHSASVHAKCAVADNRLALITSANLTSAALERNMELGLLIRGGPVPERLRSHLNALVSAEVIRKWKPSG